MVSIFIRTGTKSVHKHSNAWWRWSFLTQPVKQQSLPLIHSISIKSNFNFCNTTSNFIQISWKWVRKWSQRVLLCTEHVIPSHGQGHWKWYMKEEVNDACKQGRYGKTGWKVCILCLMFQFLWNKTAIWPAGWTTTADYIDRYVSHGSKNLFWMILKVWQTKSLPDSIGFNANVIDYLRQTGTFHVKP